MSEDRLEEIEEILKLPEEEILKQFDELEAELNELMAQKKMNAIEVQEQLFKAPTDKEVIQVVLNYLSDDSNFDKAIEILKSEGVAATAAELREFVKEPITKEVKKIYSALIKGTYKRIEKNLKIFRDATVETPPSPKKDKSYPTKANEKVIEELWKYWDNDLPLGQTRKTWFHKLADENGLTFAGIEKIEQNNRPDSFTPKR